MGDEALAGIQVCVRVSAAGTASAGPAASTSVSELVSEALWSPPSALLQPCRPQITLCAAYTPCGVTKPAAAAPATGAIVQSGQQAAAANDAEHVPLLQVRPLNDRERDSGFRNCINFDEATKQVVLMVSVPEGQHTWSRGSSRSRNRNRSRIVTVHAQLGLHAGMQDTGSANTLRWTAVRRVHILYSMCCVAELCAAGCGQGDADAAAWQLSQGLCL